MLQRVKNLVSIVISNYNNAKYLTKCLDSIINQTYKNIEIIIVDDASTDNSLEVIENWFNNDFNGINKRKMTKLLKLPSNVGFSGAVTTGLFLCSGEYIAMQDSDDYSDAARIEKQVKYLIDNPNISAVGTNYKVFSDEDDRTKSVPNELKYGFDEIKEVYSKGKNCVCYGSLLFKGEVFDKVGGLTRKIEGAEDYEFITKLLPEGIDNIKEPLYYYRRHGLQRSIEYYGKKEMKKIKREELSVLMVLDSFNIGGTETHALSIVKQLIKAGIKVSILAGEGPMSKEFNNLNCKIYSMDFPISVVTNKLIIERYKERIGRIIKLENINLIHAHQSPSGSLAIEVGRSLNIPTVFTVHGLYYQDIANTYLPLASKVIGVSIPVYEWLLKFNIQSTVVPNGLDFKEYENSNVRDKMRKEIGIANDGFVVFYCSRLAWGKVKACENAIRSCRDLRRLENCDIYLVVAGDGPGYDDLSKIAEKANIKQGKKFIYMLGGKTNVLDYYAVCDCVLGTGRVAIEGMAAKKPVIASGNDGYCGILNKENFNQSWKIYFGDHKSNKINNASFVYEDLKYVYSNYEEVKKDSNEIYNLAYSKFNIEGTVEETIKVYLDAFN